MNGLALRLPPRLKNAISGDHQPITSAVIVISLFHPVGLIVYHFYYHTRSNVSCRCMTNTTTLLIIIKMKMQVWSRGCTTLPVQNNPFYAVGCFVDKRSLSTDEARCCILLLHVESVLLVPSLDTIRAIDIMHLLLPFRPSDPAWLRTAKHAYHFIRRRQLCINS